MLAAGVVKVRHSLTEFDELKEPKTRSGIRDLGIPQHLVLLLGAWMRLYHRPEARGLLFRTPKGGQIGAANFHKLDWKPLLDRAGLADAKDAYHFHALRHFAASWMIASGIGIMETASLLGHRTFNTTLQTYAHPVVGGHQRAALMDELATKLLALPLMTGPMIEGGLAN